MTRLAGVSDAYAMKKPVLFAFLLTLALACPFLLSAQEIDIDSPNDTPVEERIVYNHQNTFYAILHSQGFGAGFKIGKIKSIHTTTQWEFNATSLHSLKELKIISGYNPAGGRPFVYGKLNSVYVARFGYGQEKRIYGKPYWGGVEVRWIYEGGVSLALLKPYYYYVITYKPSGNGTYVETLEELRFDDQSQWMDIYGKAGFLTGINETTLSPGIHVKGGISFDFGSSRARVQAVNIGAMAECFPMGVSIMDSQRNRPFFLTFFLSYNWGSRFNKY